MTYQRGTLQKMVLQKKAVTKEFKVQKIRKPRESQVVAPFHFLL